MTKIFATIIAFLLMLFPESGTLLAYQQQLAFPGAKVVAEEIVDSIKDGDIETLINMYSESAKNTGEVTIESIESFINFFDSEVVSGKFIGADGSDYVNHGTSQSHRQIKIELKTSRERYIMYATWVITDTENPEKVGLVQMTLFDSEGLETYIPIAQVPITKN